MLPLILIVVGVGSMLLGALSLASWLGGKAKWLDAGVYDRQGTSKVDRQFIDLYFIVVVITPLLVGAILIVFALRSLL
ncbi:MAG: hypothetical protein KAU28_02730 [Phycisphaerae bacterium]|nr:hypothetical protein [Phycisphaerae bacterium]